MTVKNLLVALVAMGYTACEGGVSYRKVFEDGDIVLFAVVPDDNGTVTVLIDEVVEGESLSYRWEDQGASETLYYIVSNGYYNE